MGIDDFLNNLDADINRQLTDSFDFSTLSGQENSSQTDTCMTFCPECGAGNDIGSAFCCECGNPLETPENEALQLYNGIILTDTSKLAEKYSCHREVIISGIQKFIEESKEFDRNWAFMDLTVSELPNHEDDWRILGGELDKFMQINNINPSPATSLFIIGGHDVIPHPVSDNPSGGYDEYDSVVFSDFYYSFSDGLSLDFLDYRKARCNVGRLPLETGLVETTFEEDILAYLDRSIEIQKHGGITIGRAVMTSNVDWIPASREMSRNLPTPHFDNVEGETLDNMFLSPEVLVDMPGELAEKYYSSIGEADMLVFNLHGASDQDSSGFYSHDLAFSIDSLRHTSAKIFNTVACWGGRYIKYRRKDSMLLNAIYDSDVLLYAGSCVPALGKCGHYENDVTWRIQPAAYSESFMSRFCEYQCLGKLNAGESFLKAKCDYYNSSRMVEDDENILSTVLMFNLYGNPALNTVPDIDAIAEIQESDGTKEERIPFRKMKREVVMRKSKDSGRLSVLDSIRLAVDRNLESIHEEITQDLYAKLGLEPRQLSSVEKYETVGNNGLQNRGYMFNYDINNGCVKSRIIAKTDNSGNIVSLMQTK